MTPRAGSIINLGHNFSLHRTNIGSKLKKKIKLEVGLNTRANISKFLKYVIFYD